MISRQTKQKQIISEELHKFQDFFTAEELYLSIRKKQPTIGIATIYRFLKGLVKQKQLHTYTCERRTIYSKQHTEHSHFICQRCQGVQHFTVKDISFLKPNQYGKLCHFQIELHGICKECAKKD
ncbi:hypothetical protein COV18_04265 [Candidatus Woesearchaeota archaeon CG10_big_fil_rev_8_21_14_0_10_37_12]|nr:MAG: hypothetical protein COV18_04265 [Candidatus Woesearchaeota archaeon CG10_big_fil_rev_8_21_14_0_10_37_12]